MRVTFLSFIQVPDTAQSIQTGLGNSFCSLSRLSLPKRPHSLFLLDHSEQDEESLSAPGPDCLCQARASFWSGGSVQTQDCYTQSCSCES